MNRMLGAVAGLSLGLLAVAGAAGAQELGATRAVTFGIAGGATVPLGDAGDIYETGYNLMGSLALQPAALPVGLRLDVAYHNLGGKTIVDDLFEEEFNDLKIISGTANAVLTVSNSGGVKPYVIGGVGLYNLNDDVGDSPTKFGLNGGAGIEFGLSGFNTFLEARYHSVFLDDGEGFGANGGGNLNLVPIVFGFRF